MIGGMAEVRTWRRMWDQVAQLLVERTGEDVATWNARIAQERFASERSLRSWLDERGVTGYPQQLLVFETFGYPEYLRADAEELISGQYADRPQLRPILDAILDALPTV